MNYNIFDDIFSNARKSFSGFGTTYRFLLAKRKHTKKLICDWRASEHLKENDTLKLLKLKVDDLEKEAGSRMLTEVERCPWKKYKEKILELERMAKLDL